MHAHMLDPELCMECEIIGHGGCIASRYFKQSNNLFPNESLATLDK